MRTRSNDVSPIAGGRVASPTALDAGRTPTAPCGEAPTLMSSQAERRRPTSWRRGLPLREDKNGDPYWKNPGDEARFDRYLKLSAKCALGRAQFESPRYAAIDVANQSEKVPDIYKRDPYKVMEDIVERWIAADEPEKAEKAIDVTPAADPSPSRLSLVPTTTELMEN